MTRFCRSFATSAVVGLIGLWAVASVLGSGPRESMPAATLTVHHPKVVILKKKRRLHLFDGDRLVRSYPISLGFDPVANKRYLSDGRTPEGMFRICMKNRDSKHRRFLGIDYPDVSAAVRGLAEGLITEGEYAAIVDAHGSKRRPPWNTALGGGLGIHGTGPSGGTQPDWTAGCVAVSDQHVEELFAVLREGDPVEILP